ncbi:hypothetical protein ACTVJH_13985 [Desulfoplanes sp. PS50]|jgi:hypothetical protein
MKKITFLFMFMIGLCSTAFAATSIVDACNANIQCAGKTRITDEGQMQRCNGTDWVNYCFEIMYCGGRVDSDRMGIVWDTPGTYQFVVPEDVIWVHVVAVGGGAGGDNATMVGGDSYFKDPSIVWAQGGLKSQNSRASYVGDGGGSGGKANGFGGGGAGGYSGNGGDRISNNITAPGLPGSGGGGGAGGYAGYGGGVGLYGEGPSGAGGQNAYDSGQGDSGGDYGGGGGYGCPGKNGAVRVMWGDGRSFPDNAGLVLLPEYKLLASDGASVASVKFMYFLYSRKCRYSASFK